MFGRGLRYAFGPAEMEEGRPSSAFSKGDILVYDSTSSLSRAPLLTLSTIDIAGVAAANSLQSFRNQVTFFKAGPDTVFWSDLTGGISTLSAGRELDFVEDSEAHPMAINSELTARAVVERELARTNQDSGATRILVRLIRHGGAVEHT